MRVLVETPAGTVPLDSFFAALFELALKQVEQRHPRPSSVRVSSGLLDTVRAAEFLGISKQTMANWRMRGNGPPFIKMGGAVRYKPEDLNSWLDARRERHTTEARHRVRG